MRGRTIQLYTQIQTGTDWSNRPIYEEALVDVNDVLINSPTAEDIAQTLDLFGKHVQYVLSIPKGDENDWTNKKVFIPGYGMFRTITDVQYMEENTPTRWNKEVKVERYGESEG